MRSAVAALGVSSRPSRIDVAPIFFLSDPIESDESTAYVDVCPDGILT